MMEIRKEKLWPLPWFIVVRAGFSLLLYLRVRGCYSKDMWLRLLTKAKISRDKYLFLAFDEEATGTLCENPKKVGYAAMTFPLFSQLTTGEMTFMIRTVQLAFGCFQ